MDGRKHRQVTANISKRPGMCINLGDAQFVQQFVNADLQMLLKMQAGYRQSFSNTWYE